MKHTFLVLTALVLLVNSCGDNNGHSRIIGTSGQEVETVSIINPMADFKFQTMIANLPSPLETFNTIRTVQMEMSNFDLTPTEASVKLTTTDAKAYGYGFYIVDMGYMAYQHQNQQTLTYLQTCRELAESLGARAVFDQNISANFEENSQNEVQFVKMMDNAFDAMDQYLVDNERFINAIQTFTGSWLESQIITCHILRNHPYSEEAKPVYESICAQKKHASNLLNVMNEIGTEMDVSILNSIEDIMMFYAGFSSPDAISQESILELEVKLIDLKNYMLK